MGGTASRERRRAATSSERRRVAFFRGSGSDGPARGSETGASSSSSRSSRRISFGRRVHGVRGTGPSAGAAARASQFETAEVTRLEDDSDADDDDLDGAVPSPYGGAGAGRGLSRGGGLLPVCRVCGLARATSGRLQRSRCEGCGTAYSPVSAPGTAASAASVTSASSSEGGEDTGRGAASSLALALGGSGFGGDAAGILALATLLSGAQRGTRPGAGGRASRAGEPPIPGLMTIIRLERRPGGGGSSGREPSLNLTVLTVLATDDDGDLGGLAALSFGLGFAGMGADDGAAGGRGAGASQECIDALQRAKATRDMLAMNTECCVCKEALEEGDEVSRLPSCAHVYHPACIAQWLKVRASCPVCRAHVAAHADADAHAPADADADAAGESVEGHGYGYGFGSGEAPEAVSGGASGSGAAAASATAASVAAAAD